jgi:hypothetical protein
LILQSEEIPIVTSDISALLKLAKLKERAAAAGSPAAAPS